MFQPVVRSCQAIVRIKPGFDRYQGFMTSLPVLTRLFGPFVISALRLEKHGPSWNRFPWETRPFMKTNRFITIFRETREILLGTTSESHIKLWLRSGIPQHTGESHATSHQASRTLTTHAHRKQSQTC